MLPQQPLGCARFTCLDRFERRWEQINHRAIQRFRSDHRGLFNIYLEKMEKEPVPAQQFPFFDRELRNKAFIELRVCHRLQADLKTMPGSMSSIMETFSARCKPDFSRLNRRGRHAEKTSCFHDQRCLNRCVSLGFTPVGWICPGWIRLEGDRSYGEYDLEVAGGSAGCAS